ncbi:MAG: 50S ribosomal protein L31e [Nanoarchaeota archaeon]
MATKKTPTKTESKLVLERTYIVPLRRGWLKVPHHRRGNKAIKTLREFMLQHMKVYDRDLRKIKIDQYLNNEIRFRGMRKPPAKIKVIAKKFDDDIVRVTLAEPAPFVTFKQARDEKRTLRIKKDVAKKQTKTDGEKSDEKKSEDSKKEEVKEKEEAAKEQNLSIAKEQAKDAKHVSKGSERPTYHRTALKK